MLSRCCRCAKHPRLSGPRTRPPSNSRRRERERRVTWPRVPEGGSSPSQPSPVHAHLYTHSVCLVLDSSSGESSGVCSRRIFRSGSTATSQPKPAGGHQAAMLGGVETATYDTTVTGRSDEGWGAAGAAASGAKAARELRRGAARGCRRRDEPHTQNTQASRDGALISCCLLPHACCFLSAGQPE